MKEENKKKRKIVPTNEQKKQVKKFDPKQQQELDDLVFKADLISPANKKIDKVEIVELRSGGIINIDEYIRENYIEKSTHFFLESFYFPIADLAGISRDAMRQFVKPLIVPLLKKFLLYGRFPNAVQERLYKKNKYTGYYSRQHWNYQWLTKKADAELREFITQFEDEAERVLAANGNLKTFIVEYCRKYHLAIQPEIFEQQ